MIFLLVQELAQLEHFFFRLFQIGLEQGQLFMGQSFLTTGFSCEQKVGSDADPSNQDDWQEVRNQKNYEKDS